MSQAQSLLESQEFEPQVVEQQTAVLNSSPIDTPAAIAPHSLFNLPIPTTLFKPPKPPGFQAQTPPNPITPLPPPVQPNPTPEPRPAPASPELTPTPPPITPPDATAGTACVRGIIVAGSTVFSQKELDTVVQTQIDPAQVPSCQLSDQDVGFQVAFEQLIQARTAITDFYVEQGYVTSGAFIPEQTMVADQITIQVVEGRLEAIEVSGNQHLKTSYIRDRLEIAGATPLNQDQLISGLQLLQQDPLINTINAELAAGIEPSSSILKVQVQEADPWQSNLGLDNARSSNVGTVRRQVQAGNQNILGIGDRFTVGLSNTNGSGTFDLSYSVPLNPRNGRLTLSYSDSNSRVIRDPFDVLNIESDSDTYEVSFRQPFYQSPSEEFAAGLTFSRHESTVTLNPLNTGELPFPTRGSDSQGQTHISAFRFFQDWVKRNENQVLAARSQFNLGVDLLGTTQNATAPDGQFFSWQGQGQWVRRLGRDTLLVVRGNVQWSDRPLPSVEQISIGGAQTVRGYSQSFLTTDGGAMATAEVRLPIFRVPEVDGLLQLTPFVDFGIGWNVDEADPSPNALTSVGLGLLWQDSGGWSARLDWGIPLTEVTTTGNSAQEDGLHFSINWSPF
ncbi:MAG: ShlB/FhaC/HecB family hemolysin secretion/activation protein [Spirulina sp. SIO3F2]|nr:ShlB/FhaC/HecB family hemolysin secretion/activation protein [Spirulina sp. SIO3F2]